MMIIKDNSSYYLCDDNNFLYLESFCNRWSIEHQRYKPWYVEDKTIDFREYYEELAEYELGSQDYLLNEVKFFEYKNNYANNGTSIIATEHFLKDFRAWARQIKINHILDV